MVLTQAEEDRILRSYEGMYHNQAKRYDIPGLEHEDKVQVARLAALNALRKFDPGRPKANLAGWLQHSVMLKLKQQRWRFLNPKHQNKVEDARLISLDDDATSKGGSWADNIPSPDKADRNLLLMACESLCQSEVEVAILEAIQSGSELKEVGARYAIKAQYLSKLKNKLMDRLRRELFA